MERNKREITVRSLMDLRTVISPFLSGDDSDQRVDVSAKMQWVDDRGVSRSTDVIAESRDLTPRKLLIEGFDLVKKRMMLADKAREEAEREDEDDDLLPERIKWGLFDIDSQYFHVDTLIKQEFDGERKGLRIRWEIEDGNFEYDPYIGKLYKVD